MEKSIVVLEKNTPRVPLADWHGRVWELRSTCDSKRYQAWELRNQSTVLRNETESKSNWDVYHTNNRIKDRIVEVQRWKETMEQLLERIDKELNLMAQEKALTEAEINFLDLNLSVINECLTQRDQRGGSDLCTDEGEIEIKNELRIIESLKQMLTLKCQSAWEQMNQLKEVKYKIWSDLQNKSETICLEQCNLDLDRNSSGISLKRDPLRVPANLISYECWDEQTMFLKTKIEQELSDSKILRESMYVPREKAKNDLRAQNDVTNFALRKRIYETQRIRNELEWQRLNMAKDLEKLHAEVENLDRALDWRKNDLMLAETRAENRCYRPGSENCRDEVSVGLQDEIAQLKQSMRALEDKYEESRILYSRLEDQLALVDQELANKNHALQVDIRGLDLRMQLKRGPHLSAPDTQTDRNLALINATDEIAPH